MALPLRPFIEPMLSEAEDEIPSGPGWRYEPKWDGFRALVFRDGESIHLQSRKGQPLERYFPELLPALAEALPPRAVVDGEIVVAGPRGLDFDALSQRIHPAASRIQRLSKQTPAAFVAFDLLALGDDDLREQPFSERRSRLETAIRETEQIFVTPQTPSREDARRWFEEFEGAGLDGVVAKREDLRYRPGERVMVKVKHLRTVDCVVGGYRKHKQGGIGSLLLGLYDDAGALQHVGVVASFTDRVRRELVDKLAPYRQDALVDHPWREWAAHSEGGARRVPGMTSRWNADKDLSWVPLRAELVVEVAYDHMQGTRFRHTAQLRRWRPDKRPRDCTYAQLEVVAPAELARIFRG